MIDFRVLKQSKKSSARIGILKTPHGAVETPAFVPVATQAAIKALPNDKVVQAHTQLLIANTFHLHLRPGEKVIRLLGGLNKFMNWQKPLMTDSGGFQVFSLGFGRDLGIGKVMKYFSEDDGKNILVRRSHQPSGVKIMHDGVLFRSPICGKELFFGPRESIKIQEALGADMIFTFDECTPPKASLAYIKQSLERTHAWAVTCRKVHETKQALFGIVQGSRYKALREESAQFISGLGFDGFGIGGDLGTSKKETLNILRWSFGCLDPNRPRHLLGIGHLADIPLIIKNGVDLFDCIVPTHYARRGIVFTSAGRLDMKKSSFAKDKKPLDTKCVCCVCANYTRAYIAHLFRAREITGMQLATFHNLHYFNAYVASLREEIKNGKL